MRKFPAFGILPIHSRYFIKVATFCALLLIANNSQAQILAWQFALPEPSKGVEISLKSTTTNEFLEPSILTRGKGVVPKQGNSRGFSGNFGVDESFEEAQKSNSYFQFEITPKKGYQVSLSNLKSTLRRQAQSAHIYRWTYSLDGEKFTALGTEETKITSIVNNGVAQDPIDLSAIKDLQKTSKTIILRLYAWGGLTNEGKAIAFGFGKSDAKGSNAIEVDGKVTKK